MKNFKGSIFSIILLCLSFSGISQIPNDECLSSLEVSCGDMVTGSTAMASYDGGYNGCYFENSPDVWFSLEGDGMIYTLHYIDIDGGSAYEVAVSLNNCGGFSNTCYGDGRLSSTEDSISFGTEIGRTYLINISECCNSNDFSFELSCREAIANDLCMNAQSLNCSETIISNTYDASIESIRPPCNYTNWRDVWYLLDGDDMVHVFDFNDSESGAIHFQIYEETCEFNEELCPREYALDSNNTQFAISASIGQQFLIRVHNRSLTIGYEFSFDHSCRMPEINDLCENALLVECGQQLEGNTIFADYAENYTGCGYGGYPDLWYIIEGDDLMHVFSIDSLDVSDVVLRITTSTCEEEFENCTQISLDNGYNGNEEQSFFAEAGNFYLIEIFTLYDPGYFSLNHFCQAPQTNNDCSSAQQLDCDTDIEGSFLLSSPSNLNLCNSQGLNDLWYRIQGDDMVHSIQNDPSNLDNLYYTFIQLYESDNCNFLNTCLAELVFYNDEDYFFFAEAGQTYYLRVYAYRDHDFYIEHNCSNPIQNDFCDTPQISECGEAIIGSYYGATSLYNENECFEESQPDLWYLIEGDGMIHSLQIPTVIDSGFVGGIRIEVFENSCLVDANDCPEEFFISEYSPNANFLTQIGTDYLIRVFGECCNGYVDFEIEHFCNELVQNDECQNAIQFECNETIIGNLEFATHTGVYNDCFYEDYNDVWYTIEGDDLIHLFYSASEFQMDIYEGQCGQDNLFCQSQTNFDQYQNWFSLNTENGIAYTIRIWSGGESQSTFSIEHTCLPLSENNTCTEAIEIGCGESILGNTGLAIQSDINPYCSDDNAPDLWYTIAGDGDLHTFEYINDLEYTNNLAFHIYENTCEEISVTGAECPVRHILYSGQGLDLIFDVGITYLIRITSQYNYSEIFDFEIVHDCIELLPNDSCDNPQSISCNDDFITGNTEQATHSDFYNGCTYEDSNDLWYVIAGDGQIHTISHDTSEYESLYLERFSVECNDDHENCLTAILINSDVEFSFLASLGTNYYFRISYAGYEENGPFSLNHECSTPAPNDSCETPELVACGQNIIGDTNSSTSADKYNGCRIEDEPDLWYLIPGDGMLHQLAALTSASNGIIRFEIYEESCSDDAYIYCPSSYRLIINGAEHTFLAEAGTNYYIRMYYEEYQLSGPFEVEHICLEPLENDTCVNAVPLACDERIVIDPSIATYSNQTPQCPPFNGYPDFWYSLEGNDMIHQIEYLFSESGSLFVTIYELSCEDIIGDDCGLNYNLSQFTNTGNFFAEQGSTYLLQIHTYSIPAEKLVLRINCIEPSPNNDCAAPLQISCSENIIGDMNTAVNGDGRCNVGNGPNLWYEIQGDGMIHSFSLTDTDFSFVSASISESECGSDEFDCITQSVGTFTGPFIVYLEFNKTYLISVSGCCREDGYFELEHICMEPIENDNCETPTLLSCDQVILGNTIYASTAFIHNECVYEDERDLWYTIEGDNLYHQFKYLDVDNNSGLTLSFYQGACGEFESCLGNYSLNRYSNSVFIYTEIGMTYVVRMSQCCGRNGEYSIEYKCLPPSENDECIDATPLLCGDSLVISLNTASPISDYNFCYDSNYNDVWYSFNGDNLQHSIQLNSNNNESLIVEILEGDCEDFLCYQDFQLNDYTNQVTFFLEENKPYLFRFHSYEINADFELIFDCFEAPVNDQCDSATSIECAETITGTLQGASGDTDHHICMSYYESTPGVWYSFIGTGEIIDISVNDGEDSNFQIFVYEDSCENTDCLSANGTFESETGVPYYIIVRSYNSQLATFDISLNCFLPESNDLCINAQPISCGDTILTSTTSASFTNIHNGCIRENENDVWYTIEGDGNIAVFEYLSSDEEQFDVEVFEWDCSGDIICVTNRELNASRKFISFLTEPLKLYTIRISIDCCETGELSFDFDCLPVQPNDECAQATVINCGDNISGDLLTATESEVDAFCIYAPNDDLWFELIGDDMIHTFTLDSVYHVNFLVIEIYEESCPEMVLACDNVIDLYDNNHQFNLFLELGKSYYFRIFGNAQFGSFDLDHSCTIPAPNNNCESPIALECDDVVTIDLAGTTNSEIDNNCQTNAYADLWYSIIGDGSYKVFTVSEIGVDAIQASIYNSNCDSGLESCIFDMYLSDYAPTLSFYAEDGVEYLVQFGIFCCEIDDYSIDLSISCNTPLSNDECDSPIPLQCGDPIETNTLFAGATNGYNGCFNNNVNDVWFSIEGDDMFHSLTLDSMMMTPTARVRVYTEDCSSQFTDCRSMLFFNDLGVSRSFYAESGTSYLLQISTTYNSNNGYMAFTHECSEPAIHNVCETAIPLTCDDTLEIDFLNAFVSGACSSCYNGDRPDLWYSIIGDGMVHRFYSNLPPQGIYIELYEGGCDEFYECHDQRYIYNDRSASFFLEAGVEYRIRFLSDGDRRNFVFEHSCSELPQNISCEDSDMLVCGDVISVNTFSNNQDLNIPDCFEYINDSNGLWYSFEGNNSYVTIVITDADFYPRIRILNNDCGADNCGEIEFFFDPEGLNFKHSFYALQSSIYHFYIAGYQFDQNGLVEFSLNCQEIPLNISCVYAETMTCNQEINGDLSVTPAFNIQNECGLSSNGPGLWYSFTGNGTEMEFELSELDFQPTVYVYDAACENDLCSDLDFDVNEQVLSYPNCQDSDLFSISIPCVEAVDHAIDVPVRLDNYDDLGYANFQVRYDPSIFSYVNYVEHVEGLVIDFSSLQDSILYFSISTNSFAIPIEITQDIILTVSFEKISDSLSYSPIRFGDNIVARTVENTSYRDVCIDPGIVHFENSDGACDDELSFILPTVFGQQYNLFIAGQNEYDTGTFTLDLKCQHEADIPTLSEWGIICLAILLLIMGCVSFRQEELSFQTVEARNRSIAK